MYAGGELIAQSSWFGQLTHPAVSGVELARQPGNVAELAATCQAWGTALATLHTMSTRRSATLLAPRPAVLNPRRLMPSMRDAALGSGYATVLEAYESSRDLRAAVSEVDDRWTEQHWIHGNLNETNVIVEQRPALRVSFVDLEDAGLGDPAWDLASAMDTIAWLSPRWHVMPQLLMENLLQGYRRAGGPGRLYPAIQAVGVLATALRVAGSEHESNRLDGERADLTVLLGRARAYAARVGCLRAVA
jgi:aminoglycoside phosphotransferase (APT) family kinase protein